MKSTKVSKLAYTGLFTAIICVVTMIHIGSGNGYIHVGDAIIYIGSIILPFPLGLIAGGVGGGLSDFFSGYPLYIIPTLIIKSLNSLCFYLIIKKSGKIITVKSIIAAILSGTVTIIGYTITSSILYNTTIKVAFISTSLSNLIQSVGSLIFFIVLGKTIDKIGLVKKLNI